MLKLLCLTTGGHGSAATQYNEQMAVVACGWEFIAAMTRSSDAARAFLLILPQLLLLFMVVSLEFKLRNHKQTIVVLVVMTSMVIGAVVYSSFRLGISLCCCSRSLCPITFPAGLTPSTSACGLVVNNCYMAFIRKIVHFYGTTSLLFPLASTIFATLRCASRQSSGRTLCQAFLEKTK
ncbi:hypothetical protein F442_19843 [Phytophthora nicotianae P10297]|uniref:Uncharacterized protein n=5 Tax=Phytophthora nicotianae TaxID=4792 RepID=W2Y8G8_PHYNI|nr:hypothetical protein F442_19843 [Phytophthora nicotianae P10297]